MSSIPGDEGEAGDEEDEEDEQDGGRAGSRSPGSPALTWACAARAPAPRRGPARARPAQALRGLRAVMAAASGSAGRKEMGLAGTAL